MIKTRGLYRLLIILVTVFFYFQLLNTVFAQNEYDIIPLYRCDYNENNCSYHFSTKSYGSYSDGEFYFDHTGNLTANNVGQQGLIDLGVSGVSVQFDPKTIDIPSTGFYQFVEAKQRHIYLTQARKGEDNRYILFRINSLYIEGKAAYLEYYILETGTIIVRTNTEGRFRIQGPRIYNAEGKSWEKERTLTGDYTIIFESVSGYKTPSSQTKLLSRGGTIVFEADYEQNPTPTPTPTPTSTSIDVEGGEGTKPSPDITNVIVALIGALATIIAAYFGYRAVKNK